MTLSQSIENDYFKLKMDIISLKMKRLKLISPEPNSATELISPQSNSTAELFIFNTMNK
jgi:hypothetical protein